MTGLLSSTSVYSDDALLPLKSGTPNRFHAEDHDIILEDRIPEVPRTPPYQHPTDCPSTPAGLPHRLVLALAEIPRRSLPTVSAKKILLPLDLCQSVAFKRAVYQREMNEKRCKISKKWNSRCRTCKICKVFAPTQAHYQEYLKSRRLPNKPVRWK